MKLVCLNINQPNIKYSYFFLTFWIASKMDHRLPHGLLGNFDCYLFCFSCISSSLVLAPLLHHVEALLTSFYF